MPKRAIVAISATALALVLLFSFKTPDDPGLGAARRIDRSRRSPAPTSRDRGADGARARRRRRPHGATTAGADQAPAATPAPAGGTLADGTVAGPVVNTRFGPVQVQVTIANGKITDVDALELPSDHPALGGDQRLRRADPPERGAPGPERPDRPACPGATYTSIAYERSLQAALDQARG